MRFASLGSGSSGNATLVDNEDGGVLLFDCGFGLRETERRLERAGVLPSRLTGIVVTHEHGDHVKGVGPLARKYELPVYMTMGTYVSRDYGKLSHLNIIAVEEAFNIAGFSIMPVAVPHDAREPAQYTVEYRGIKLGILTDIGSITPHVVAAYNGCHGLLVEANHDLDMLARGPYPPSLKALVAGNWGHLNNFQTLDFVNQVDLSRIQQIVIGHISEKNNSVEQAKMTLACLYDIVEEPYFACQDEGFDWLVLTAPHHFEEAGQENEVVSA